MHRARGLTAQLRLSSSKARCLASGEGASTKEKQSRRQHRRQAVAGLIVFRWSH